MHKITPLALAAIVASGSAFAQSSPGFSGLLSGNSNPLTASSLNTAFVTKQDYGKSIVINIPSSSQAYFGATGSNNSIVTLDNASGGNQTLLQFEDAGTTKWQAGKLANNSYVVYDATHNAFPFSVSTTGALSLGESPTAAWLLAPTNTGTATYGLQSLIDGTWQPSISSANNNYLATTIYGVSLPAGGSIASRWATTNNGATMSLTTTGPAAGTPTSASGMADSHTIAHNDNIIIPAGLCDGLNGQMSGGVPTNYCYQEIGGYEFNGVVLSNGHYIEGIGSYAYDNSGSTGVPARMTGFISGMSKNAASNLYPSYGYVANSNGTQQTTYAPTTPFFVTGGWQTGIDLTGGTYNSGYALKANAYVSGSAFQVYAVLTVSTLPTCNAGLKGTISAVSDATAPAYNAALTGGGAVGIPVYCNGSAWTAH